MTEIKGRVPWHEDVVLRGLRHRLTWWGERTANPVVLLHGWMDCSETWQFLVDCLPEDWSCVALDFRGFGGSEWPEEGYWFADYFADLEALLDVVSPAAPARIIAHSMGGNVAAMYGGMRPKRIEWLVNLEGIGLRRTSPEEAPDRYIEWLDHIKNPLRERRYASVGALADFLVARNPRMPRARAEFLARAWTREDTNGGRAPITLVFDPRHRNVSPVLYRREEAEACWRRFEAPILLMLAELSEIRGRVGADGTEDYFRSVFRNVHIVTLPGVGHMMHIEAPDSIARHILEFAAGR
jgi:pimeloyl-ACP methyl ester carboxylesterase